MSLDDYRELSIWQVLERHAEAQGAREAFACGERRLTYAELRSSAAALAAALHARGVGAGDKVAAILPNGAEFLISYFACARLGAIYVPLNTRYRQHELTFMLDDCQARVLITVASYADFDYLALIAALRPSLPLLAHVIAVGEQGADAQSFAALLETSAAAPPAPVAPQDDVFTILYTSGTTGVPKGAMLTHANVVGNAIAMAEAMRWTAADVLLVAVPMFHVFGMTPSIMSAIVSGSRMVALETYGPEAALRLIERERVTIHHGVPTMFILELNHPSFAAYDLSSLRTGIIAAAPCPVEVVRRIRTAMGCNICVAYGLTETSPCLTITRFDDSDEVRSATVGRALPGIDIRIVDDQRQPVADGVVGELAARGYAVMRGYYRRPEATAAVIEDGWLYTGDLATLDQHGYVRIVGRKKEMIVRGGFKIYPREIEELYYAHPKVQEVAIVGLPDPVLGERSCACIKLRDGHDATADELLDYVRGQVADYKVPDRIVFVATLPTTASGKVRKIYLAEQLAGGATF
jgi:acyl-CoA synthetase (AMP-forming)/AMP-acid ligase II